MLADTSGAVRVKVSGDPQKLLERLRSRGLEGQLDGPNLDVQRTDNVEMIILEEIHKEPSLTLRYLGRKTRTLEDAFMALVEGRSDME
jgi:hypothetical protein